MTDKQRIGAKGRALGLAAAATLLGALPAIDAAAEEAAIDSLPVEQVEQIVRDYLMREPDVIYQALEALQQRRTAEKAAAQQAVLADRQQELTNDPATPIVGNPEGDVTLVEFFDYRCSYCRRVLSSMQALMAEDPNLRIAFKELPVLGEDSVRAARAALASQMQDENRYLDFHLALMQSSDLSLAGIRATAEAVGLDANQLELDMEDEAVAKAIEANYQLASALGIEGTPAFVIGKELIPGAVGKEQLSQLIEVARTGTN
jgi:protein-disulfide isomerase